MTQVGVTVNGQMREADVEPRTLLVYFLRESLGLTGTNVGCDTLANGSDPAAAAKRASEGTSPPSDAFASAEYRQELAKVLVRRSLEEAMSR